MTAEPRQHRQRTASLWQRFSVAYDFPVCFTDGLLDPANPLLFDTLARHEPVKRHRFTVFIDDGVIAAMPDLVAQITTYASAHAEALELLGDPVVMPGGEAIKSDWRWVEQMQQVLVDRHVDRHSYVIGIGGGALLDAVGLVAATSHRGIRHVRVPTTVLAQNDSGVGVKNGVNLFGQKNYLGTFAPPFAVLNDSRFIDVLPARDKIAGMAEAVKVALIRDADFYVWIEQNTAELQRFEPVAMRRLIERCAELHMHQIGRGGDPFESGSARPLDYGHWSAHRLESLTDYRIRHGEAVAIGLALDTRYSVACGLLETGSDARVCRLLEALGFRLWDPALEQCDADGELELLQGLLDFQEHLGGALTITLLEQVGRGVEVHAMDNRLIRESIAWLADREREHTRATTREEPEIPNGHVDDAIRAASR